jgi:hypothetical protein
MLSNVKSTKTGTCDFQKILPIDGAYIANRYEASQSKGYTLRPYDL